MPDGVVRLSYKDRDTRKNLTVDFNFGSRELGVVRLVNVLLPDAEFPLFVLGGWWGLGVHDSTLVWYSVSDESLVGWVGVGEEEGGCEGAGELFWLRVGPGGKSLGWVSSDG